MISLASLHIIDPNTIFSQLTVTKMLSSPEDLMDNRRGSLPENVSAANLMTSSLFESKGRTFMALKMLSLTADKGTEVVTLAVLSCMPVNLPVISKKIKSTKHKS